MNCTANVLHCTSIALNIHCKLSALYFPCIVYCQQLTGFLVFYSVKWSVGDIAPTRRSVNAWLAYWVSLHCTALHWISIQCSELYWAALHITLLQCIEQHYNSFYCFALYCTILQGNAVLYTIMNGSVVYCMQVHCNTVTSSRVPLAVWATVTAFTYITHSFTKNAGA